MDYLKVLREVIMHKLTNRPEDIIDIYLTREQALKICKEITKALPKESDKNIVYTDTDSIATDSLATDSDRKRKECKIILQDILVMIDYLKKNADNLSFSNSKHLIDETDSLCKKYIDLSGYTCGVIIDWHSSVKPFIERMISGIRVQPIL